MGTVLAAFLLSAVWPWFAFAIPLLAAVLLVGAVDPRAGLFRQLYVRVLRPAGIVRPQAVQESPRPHNFAQVLGGIVLAAASLALALSASPIAWALAMLVAVLASVNLFFGF